MATKLHELLGLKKEEKILLDQNQICSPQAFLDQPNFSLQKILNVSARQTERQKEILREKIRLDVVKGSAYLAKCRESQQFFSTGIEQFDDLFTNKAITSGDIIEIIGLAATGKSMLLNTILINVFEQVDNIDVYFIDTKHDFKATKLANMMDARGMSETKKLQVLKQIIIERVGTPEDLVKSLRFLLNTRGQHENVKLIMIDSITVPFYLYSGHSMFNLSLMNQTFELLKALAKENIAVSCGDRSATDLTFLAFRFSSPITLTTKNSRRASTLLPQLNRKARKAANPAQAPL